MQTRNVTAAPSHYLRRELPTVVIAYAPDSFAAREIEHFGRHVRAVLRQLLQQLKAPSSVLDHPERILVIVHETPDNGSAEASADPGAGVVTIVLNEQTRGIGLTRELARVVIHRLFTGTPTPDILARSVSPAYPVGLDYIVQGVARALAREIDAPNHRALETRTISIDDLCTAAAAAQEWKLPLYECAVGGPDHAPSPELYFAMAESFGRYLLTRDGPKALHEFLREAAGGDLSYAAAVAYGKYIEALEAEWIEHQLRERRGRRTVTWIQFLRQALPYFRPYPLLSAICIALVFIASIAASYAPFAFRDIIDTVNLKELTDEPWAPLAGIVEGGAHLLGAELEDLLVMKTVRVFRLVMYLFGANLLSLGAQVLLIYLVNVLGQNVLRDLRLRFLERVNGLSASTFNRVSTGDLQARFLSDLVRLADPMTQIVSYSVYHIVFLATTVGAMFLLAWQLTLVLIACVPIYLAIAGWLGPLLQSAIRARQERLAQLNADLKQMVDAHPLIQIGNLQHFLRHRATPGVEHSRRVEIRADFLTGLFSETVGITNKFFDKSVLFVGAVLAIWAGMTVGTITAFVNTSNRGVARLHSLLNIYRHVAMAAAVLRRVEEVLAYDVEPLEEPPAGVPATPTRPTPTLREGVVFDNVSFSYNGTDPILRDVNLTIPAGGKVAFVGPTGAGKTTLVNMVPRFYEPTEGAVRVDGQDTREIPIRELRSRIGLVSQDTFLFNMTIRENIGLGKIGATDDEIFAAARAARIHDFIETLPAGYQTIVGERGSRLSGGQRQRLAVARALLRNPSILILDEATSALDAETEREILEELDEVTRDKTTISITHRLALAMRADRIYVLQEGRIVESGSHDELMERAGLYRRLFENQNELILDAIGSGAESNGGARIEPNGESSRITRSSERTSDIIV